MKPNSISSKFLTRMDIKLHDGYDADPLRAFEMRADSLEKAQELIIAMTEANVKFRAIAEAEASSTFGFDKGVHTCDSVYPHRFSFIEGKRNFFNPVVKHEVDGEVSVFTNPEWANADYECYFGSPKGKHRTYYHFQVFDHEDKGFGIMLFEPRKQFYPQARYYQLETDENTRNS
jgi:hypothetical protein